jgi:hypothetical protein
VGTNTATVRFVLYLLLSSAVHCYPLLLSVLCCPCPLLSLPSAVLCPLLSMSSAVLCPLLLSVLCCSLSDDVRAFVCRCVSVVYLHTVVDGKWKNKTPPDHLDMFGEMAWKKKQKAAKAAWEEEQAKGDADSVDEDDEVSRMKDLETKLKG